MTENLVDACQDRVFAYEQIENGQRVAFRVVCPHPWVINGEVAGTAFEFTSEQIAALGGIIPIETPHSQVQLHDGEPESMGFPEVSWRARRVG